MQIFADKNPLKFVRFDDSIAKGIKADGKSYLRSVIFLNTINKNQKLAKAYQNVAKIIQSGITNSWKGLI